MGESSLLKKFHRLLAECEEDNFYSGTILEFDTEGYVPRERHTRGMIVDSKAGTRRVVFYHGSEKYIKDSSSLRVGDDVIIISKELPHRPNTYQPSIIIIPDDKIVLLAQERENFRSEGWAENAQIVSLILFFILGIISWLSNDIPFILFHRYYMYWEITFWSGLTSILCFLVVVLIEICRHHARRGIVHQCDTEIWNIISDEVTERFSFSIT